MRILELRVGLPFSAEFRVFSPQLEKRRLNISLPVHGVHLHNLIACFLISSRMEALQGNAPARGKPPDPRPSASAPVTTPIKLMTFHLSYTASVTPAKILTDKVLRCGFLVTETQPSRTVEFLFFILIPVSKLQSISLTVGNFVECYRFPHLLHRHRTISGVHLRISRAFRVRLHLAERLGMYIYRMVTPIRRHTRITGLKL